MRVRKRKNGDARREALGDLILPFDKENITPIDVKALFPIKNRFVWRSAAERVLLSAAWRKESLTWAFLPWSLWRT